MEITVGITASREGLLAHKTMRSVFRALEHVTNYEIVVHIDNGTEETISYFEHYCDNPKIHVLQNHFGDAGRSRNAIIDAAKGKYVIFVDADDLVSRNYFTEILNVLKSTKEPIIVHPDQCLCFWEDYSSYALLWSSYRSTSRMDAALALFSRNRWPSSFGASRELLKQHPYIATKNGFGHEDYALNIELSANDIKHLVANQTALFYRQKTVSYMRTNNSQAVTQPYSALFDFHEWKKYPPEAVYRQDIKEHKLTAKEKALSIYINIRSNKFLNKFITPAAKVARKLTGKKLVPPNISDWLLAEWKALSDIEIQMYPTPWLLENLNHVDLNAEWATTEAYYQLCQQIVDYPDYIFIVPWMVAGGADKVILNYLKALQEIHPDWKIAVITTLPEISTWADKLPENAFLLDFGNISVNLHEEAKELLFTRLIMQLKAQKLHIVNSLYGYQWAYRHQDLIRHNFKLYLSLFCHDIVPETDGRAHFDYADPYAIRIYPLAQKIYTDNEAVVNHLVESVGFNRDKIKVHYQPVEPSRYSGKTHPKTNQKSQLNILWASRISAQKNPELLLRIAKKLNPEEAHIDVYGRICPDCKHLTFPANSQTIKYCGAFNQFDALNLDQYDLLLYTSHIDGVPNIILESAAASLPMVASAVGGVVDFIDDGRTGFLVYDVDNEDEYLKIINHLYNNPASLDQVSRRALDLANSRHSWETFVGTVRTDFQ